MLQQRLTERLISQWKLIRSDGFCPDYSKLNRATIADVWPSCLVVRSQPKADSQRPSFQFIDIGSKAESLFKESPVGQYFNTNMKVLPAARVMKRIDEFTPTSEPIIDEGQFVNDKNRIVKFRSCLLPFGSNSEITHVLVGLSWREF